MSNAAAFDAMFAASDDPWDFRHRWYEQRKRELTLAALPRQRYAHGFEPGCANGELGFALAARCDTLLLADLSPRAVALARARVASCPQVAVRCLRVPDEWPEPEHRFDLVVVSELGYYLERDAVTRLAARIRASLASEATVLACHWQHPIADGLSSAAEVHCRLHDGLRLPHGGHWRDADFRLDVWTTDPRSVALRED